ncbi:hypothetical protein ACMG5I_02720 [Escherichia coli]|uniref:hypothetical protein n=1 Tax=Escherichia coli TaxID=562 RepID=UPI0023778BBB|nr:hypothetical protein vBEcoMphAPEC6_00675 [Escherichia phage ph0011]
MNAYSYMTERHQILYDISTKMLSIVNSGKEIEKQYLIRDVAISSKCWSNEYYNHGILTISGARNICIVKNKNKSNEECEIRTDIQIKDDGSFSHYPFHISTIGVLYNIKVLFGDEEYKLKYIDPESSTVQEDLFQMSTIMPEEVLSTVVFCSLIYHEYKKNQFDFHMIGTYIFNNLNVDRLKALNSAMDKVL